MKHNTAKPILPAKHEGLRIQAKKAPGFDKPISGLFMDGTDAELLLYDDIGEWWGMGISAESIIEQLNGMDKKAKSLTVRINSDGGDVFDGAAIYNALARQKIPVNVQIDGSCLSIATIIAMAGDTITMARNAMFMVHNPWMVSESNATGHRKDADLLDQVENGMLRIYSARTGQPEKTIKELLDAETWMGPDQARELGFVEDITEPVRIAAHRRDMSVFPYKNVPESFINSPEPPKDYSKQVGDLASRIKNL